MENKLGKFLVVYAEYEREIGDFLDSARACGEVLALVRLVSCAELAIASRTTDVEEGKAEMHNCYSGHGPLVQGHRCGSNSRCDLCRVMNSVVGSQLGSRTRATMKIATCRTPHSLSAAAAD